MSTLRKVMAVYAAEWRESRAEYGWWLVPKFVLSLAFAAWLGVAITLGMVGLIRGVSAFLLAFVPTSTAGAFVEMLIAVWLLVTFIGLAVALFASGYVIAPRLSRRTIDWLRTRRRHSKEKGLKLS